LRTESANPWRLFARIQRRHGHHASLEVRRDDKGKGGCCQHINTTHATFMTFRHRRCIIIPSRSQNRAPLRKSNKRRTTRRSATTHPIEKVRPVSSSFIAWFSDAMLSIFQVVFEFSASSTSKSHPQSYARQPTPALSIRRHLACQRAEVDFHCQ